MMVWKRIRKSLKNRKPLDYESKKEELGLLKSLQKDGAIDLFYADGAGFGMVPTVPYAWQKIGERIEAPSFPGKTLNVFGIWDGKKELVLYGQESCMDSRSVAAYIDGFCGKIKKKTVIVLDNASIHKSAWFTSKAEGWAKKGLDIFYLPVYSPQLNKIEHLWHAMKYRWIDFKAYLKWENLVGYVEKIAKNFGTTYTINFV